MPTYPAAGGAAPMFGYIPCGAYGGGGSDMLGADAFILKFYAGILS
jgi:hypothetical protein